MGEENTVRSFADQWKKKTGVTYREGMRQRIYELREVNPIELPEGTFRQAASEDLDFAIKWGRSFHTDCFGDSGNPANIERITKDMIKEGNLYFWKNPEPVSMAAVTRPTPHGISVSYVYTPPESRRKGYASAVVASLSRFCLESGRDFCTLYTDLSNPTSNSIYRKIGYNPIADVMDILFNESNER